MARHHRIVGTRGGRNPRPCGPLRVVAVAPMPAAGCPPALTLALTMRAEATATGRCGCGAFVDYPALRDSIGSGLHNLALEHEHDCPAARFTDEQIRAAIGRGEVQWGYVIVEIPRAA